MVVNRLGLGIKGEGERDAAHAFFIPSLSFIHHSTRTTPHTQEGLEKIIHFLQMCYFNHLGHVTPHLRAWHQSISKQNMMSCWVIVFLHKRAIQFSLWILLLAYPQKMPFDPTWSQVKACFCRGAVHYPENPNMYQRHGSIVWKAVLFFPGYVRMDVNFSHKCKTKIEHISPKGKMSGHLKRTASCAERGQ